MTSLFILGFGKKRACKLFKWRQFVVAFSPLKIIIRSMTLSVLYKKSDTPPEMVVVQSKKIACDGDVAKDGHPRVYLNMGAQSSVDCPYCGRRYLYQAPPKPVLKAAVKKSVKKTVKKPAAKKIKKPVKTARKKTAKKSKKK